MQHNRFRGRAPADTWRSIDGSNLFYWPKELLAAEFPRARMFSVSYDSCIKKGRTYGRIDRYLVAENLLQDLTHHSGHNPGCPVILVGKDIGGLLIKNICLLADHNRSPSREKYQSFLRDVRGILYYCTPYRGFTRWPGKFDGALFEKLGLQSVDLARLSEEFNQLSTTFNWRTKAIAGHPSIETEELCIPEGSSRYGIGEYYTVAHDLHSLARPVDTTDTTYSFLSELMSDVISEPSSSRESKSSLEFGFDENYVPLKNTFQKIDDAFESSRVVLLHGPSGTGKSSLARHYALCFEEERKKMDRSNSSPVVSYVFCGRHVVVLDVLVELLRTFNVQNWEEEFGPEESDSQQVSKLRTTLKNHLRELDALVVLDNVWEWEFLGRILVQGEKLRYLITTRNANLWSAAEHVKIEDVSLDVGRQILANYAKFEACCIPEQLQVLADELIQDVKSHPLSLATLGAVLQGGDKYSSRTWKKLRFALLAYKESPVYKSAVCDEIYPRSVDAMRIAPFLSQDLRRFGLSVTLLGYLAKARSCAVMIVNSPSCFQKLIELLGEDVAADHQEGALETLVTITSHSGLVEEIDMTFATAGSDVLLRVVPFLSQHLGRRCELAVKLIYHLAMARTCAAMIINSPSCLQKLVELLAKDVAADQQQDALNTLFLMIHNHGLVEGIDVLFVTVGSDLIVRLAQFLSPDLGWLCRLSVGLLVVIAEARTWAIIISNSCSCLQKLIGLLAGDVAEDDQNLAFVTLKKITSRPDVVEENHRVLSKIVPDLISTTFPFLSQDLGWRCEYSVTVIGHLARASSCARMIVNYPSLLQKLIEMLTQGVAAVKELQEAALLALVGIASHSGLVKEIDTIFARVGSDLLLRIVPFLSQKLEKRSLLSIGLIGQLAKARICAGLIINSPSCLEKLVDSLARDVVEEQQLLVLETLYFMARHSCLVEENDTIFATVGPDLLFRIVPFLSEGLGRRCELSIYLIGSLATARCCTEMMINSPSCLENLVDVVIQHIAEHHQGLALATLINIASHSGIVEKYDTIFATVCTDLLPEIVPLLTQHRGWRCERSCRLIGFLARARRCVVMMKDIPSCKQNLTALLAEGVPEEQQEAARTALRAISVHDAN